MPRPNSTESNAGTASPPRFVHAGREIRRHVSLSERRSRAGMAKKLRHALSERSSPARPLSPAMQQKIAAGVRWAFDEGWRHESLVRYQPPPYRAKWGMRPNAAEMTTALIVWARDKGKTDGQ